MIDLVNSEIVNQINDLPMRFYNLAAKFGGLGAESADQGRERNEEQQRQRGVASRKRRAAALGFQIAPVPTSA
jgi:hypothetical protein